MPLDKETDCKKQLKKVESALRVIYTWASYDFTHDSHPMTLDPKHVMELIERTRRQCR